MIRSLLRPWLVLIGATAACVLLAQSLNVVPPLIVQKIVDEHLTTGVRDGLLWLAWLYFGSIVGMRCLVALDSYLISVVAQGALHDLRVRLFAHLQALPMSYHD